MRAPDTGDRADRDAGPRSPAPGPPTPPPASGGQGRPYEPASPPPVRPPGTPGPVAAPPAPPAPEVRTDGPDGRAYNDRADDRADGLRDGQAAAATAVVPAGPWPTVRPPSLRAVILGRVAAGVAAVWFGVVYSITTDVHARADHLLAAIVVGGLLSLLGVVLLWLSASRIPVRVAPARGPDMGLVRDRAAARKVLRSGGTPDGEQRRLIAVDVLADARLPQVTGAVFALLGPLVMAAVNASGPLGWAGPLTAGLIVVVLALLAWRTWTAHALHRLADRRHTVPRYEESGAPWRPWP